MSQISLTRRALLQSTAIFAAATALPLKAFAQEGGRLIVAADSEPKNLNPAIVASNGVFFIASKVVEPLAEASFDGKDGLAPRLATSLGRLGRRSFGHLQAARGRDLARRQALHLGRRRLLCAAMSGSRCRTSAVWSSPISKRSTRRTSTPPSSNSPSRRRSSSSATRCPAVTSPSSPSMSTRAAPTSQPTRPTPSLPAPARSNSPSTSPANITGWRRTRPIGAKASRSSTRSSTACCRTARPRPGRSKPTRSSSPPSARCRSPISTASPRSTASRSIRPAMRG